MFCDNCRNILKFENNDNNPLFRCTVCFEDYSVSNIDTLIYADDQKKITVSRSGKSIWYYPSNPKIKKACESKTCKETIIAYENESDMGRIYGCRCNYSWKDIKEYK